MIKVNKLIPEGAYGKFGIMKFDISFDSASHLPVDTYTLNMTTFIIANGSIAKNIQTGIYYEYNNGKWNKTTNIPSDTGNSTITTNGIHTITNNDIGVNRINVDIPSSPEPTLIEKTITENGEYLPAEDEATAYSKVTVNVPVSFEYVTFPTMNANPPFYAVLCKNNNGIYVLPSGTIFDEEGPTATHYDAYILTPAISIDPSEIESGHVIFTPGENFVFEHNGTPISDITGDTITPNDGKVYYLTISRPMGQLTMVVTKTSNNFHHEIKS